jgi:hypothetical protein
MFVLWCALIDIAYLDLPSPWLSGLVLPVCERESVICSQWLATILKAIKLRVTTWEKLYTNYAWST